MQKTMFRLSAAAALGALASAAAAQTAPTPCINDAEMHALVGYLLPAALNDVSTKCGAYLPENSYLRSGVGPLVSALNDGRDAAWPGARAAFLKISEPKDAKTLKGVPDKALRPILDGFMESAMPIKVGAEQCGEINDIVEAMAPLSADQSVHLVARILNAAARGDKKMRSCPRAPQG